jgi:crotonobetainyl-CoA:carnitine CoA-transferase CaiB-like acyl-CoA transferase
MFAFFRDAFRRKTLAEWNAELGALDICYAPVATLDEVFADPQLRHRGMVMEMETPGGPTRFFGPPIKLSETPATMRAAPAGLGAHTDEVLAGLGFDAAGIAALRAEGVV